MSASVDRSPPWEEGRPSVRIRFSSSAPNGTVVERLTDDLIVEILSRVPAKSLCRFKCVSNHWLSLIHHPEHRKKLPQTLAGFFYTGTDVERLPKSAPHFVNVSGRSCPPIDTSFSFLPNHRRLDLLDCCDGLLLCRWHSVGTDECRYIVCNPAREEWVMLPEPSQAESRKVSIVRLGFDPAVSSRFYVFVLMDDVRHVSYTIAAVDVYSSETRRWVRKERGWNERIGHLGGQYQSTVFLKGCLHFVAYGSRPSPICVAAVDTEGKTSTTFRVPSYVPNGILQQSQGCLHYSSFQSEDGLVLRLVVNVLKDYETKEWMLKHTIKTKYLSGGIHFNGYRVIGVHPECDLIFYTAGRATEVMCYNMSSREVKVISKLEDGGPPYLPYVPLYAELQPLLM
ncbi:hypothetical protein CFC21_104995 [Triticum aestivum]|uniref:F-box domain-containing protein n=2 Tax=Triticum aestivum TaxID=4565 RepID=A0A3B6SMG7_WHEAT|nr:F-box protein At1g30790-like [Triticum aestivum]KAF7104068.1 hypothetical protein CFC21_104995 [Triticum aestivum]